MEIDNRTLMEMLEEVRPYKFQEGDLTAAMLSEEFEIGHKEAMVMLDKLVEEGKADKVQGIGPNKRLCWIWRKIE